MQAVGRLGNYISRSVYTVSGPFHPFGGAVDIIVVLQPDGTYKSSPWYVRFGKFQGVLKTKEKLVRINVNGVEADFHMYLDHKGEAYFLKEVDIEEDGLSAFSPPSSSGEDKDTDRKYGNKPPIKSKSCNYDTNLSNLNGISLSRKNSRVFGNRSIEDESGVVRTASMERANMAADLLDLNWSTNLASSKHKKDNLSRFSTEEDLSKGVDENLLNGCIDDDETCVVESTEILDLSKEGDDLNSVTMIKSEIAKYDSQIKELDEKEIILLDAKAENAINSVKESIEWENGSLACDSETVHIMTQLISEVKFEPERDVLIGQEIMNVHQCLENGDQITLVHEERTILEQDQTRKHGSSVGHSRISSDDSVIRDILSSEISNEEILLFGKLDDINSIETKNDLLIHADNMEEEFTDGNIGSSHDKCCSSFLANSNIINDYTNETNQLEKRLRTISSDVNINEIGNVQAKEHTRTARSLPSMSILTNSFDQQLPFVQSVVEDIKIINGHEVSPANPSIGNLPRTLEGSRRKWSFSFKRSKSMKLSEPITVGNENSNTKDILKTTSDLEETKNGTDVKPKKKKIRIGTPTSEQLASLNLKEGKNFVIFTFSTPMLGKQQVDARIFLWRWDTRVVISDVDGTITRSDLLGQVMPLVGMDWSHTGVAHLFSAIKDNGYQLLFLSARSISQAFLTRQFLFNIKQDGKALPEGPVVISPDGLFPSLFREVVRRAPHEFKIACLEDIKALFPVDTNPFYAGFGNRDTDEFSYLKVGIPRTKIFIINPKGEIVCNRRIDTKSYSSLHDLVHGMFPTMMSSSEQEDFNSWNYWKLPPPIIDV